MKQTQPAAHLQKLLTIRDGQSAWLPCSYWEIWTQARRKVFQFKYVQNSCFKLQATGLIFFLAICVTCKQTHGNHDRSATLYLIFASSFSHCHRVAFQGLQERMKPLQPLKQHLTCLVVFKLIPSSQVTEAIFKTSTPQKNMRNPAKIYKNLNKSQPIQKNISKTTVKPLYSPCWGFATESTDYAQPASLRPRARKAGGSIEHRAAQEPSSEDQVPCKGKEPVGWRQAKGDKKPSTVEILG